MLCQPANQAGWGTSQGMKAGTHVAGSVCCVPPCPACSPHLSSVLLPALGQPMMPTSATSFSSRSIHRSWPCTHATSHAMSASCHADC